MIKKSKAKKTKADEKIEAPSSTRLMKEKRKHLEVFELYLALGPERTLQKLSDKSGVSITSLSKWKNAFGWTKRIDDRETQIVEIQKDHNEIIAEERERYRKIVKACISTFVGEYNKGKIKVKSIVDLERLMKLDLALAGDPVAEKSEVQVKEEQNVNVSIDVKNLSKEELLELDKLLTKATRDHAASDQEGIATEIPKSVYTNGMASS